MSGYSYTCYLSGYHRSSCGGKNKRSSLSVQAPHTLKMSSAEAKFLPGSDVSNVPHNVTSSEFGSSIALVLGYYLIQIFLVYYRVYHSCCAITTKRPAYLNDKYIGRIRSKWVTPPHTAGSLKRCLCSMENIDPKLAKLFASGSNQSALADDSEAPISLKSNQTLGLTPEDPVILVLKTMPQTAMERGTKIFRVAPDGESPLAIAPRFREFSVTLNYIDIYRDSILWCLQ